MFTSKSFSKCVSTAILIALTLGGYAGMGGAAHAPGNQGSKPPYKLGDRLLVPARVDSPMLAIGDIEKYWIEPQFAIPAMMLGVTPSRIPAHYRVGSVPFALDQFLPILYADKNPILFDVDKNGDGRISAYEGLSRVDEGYPGWEALHNSSFVYGADSVERPGGASPNTEGLPWSYIEAFGGNLGGAISSIQFLDSEIESVSFALDSQLALDRIMGEQVGVITVWVEQVALGAYNFFIPSDAATSSGTPAIRIRVGMGCVNYEVLEDWAHCFYVRRAEYSVDGFSGSKTALIRWYADSLVVGDYFDYSPGGELLSSVRINSLGQVFRTEFDIRARGHGLIDGAAVYFNRRSLNTEGKPDYSVTPDIRLTEGWEWGTVGEAREHATFSSALRLGSTYISSGRVRSGLLTSPLLDGEVVYRNLFGFNAFKVEFN